MGLVGIFGILLSLLALPFAARQQTRLRLALFLALLVTHLAASIVYYLYVQSNDADTGLYYYDHWRLRYWDFGFGTVFVVKLVQTLKGAVGGSYLDYFLLFQTFGFWGIVVLMRVFDQIHAELEVAPTKFSYALLFLPGMHFWTSAIGKDAPLFFALSLAVWSAMKISMRMPMLVASIGLMVLFRPHIALTVTAAIALAEFFDARSSLIKKIGLLGVAAAGLVVVANTVQGTLNVSVVNRESLGEFFERQNDLAREVGGSTAVLDASYLERLLSLLFRPLFYDANGVFALVASFENLVFLFIISFMLVHLRSSAALVRQVFFLRFAFILAAMIAGLLALVFYNVGLGARQKMMFVPALFSFFVAQWAIRAARRRSRRQAKLERVQWQPSREQQQLGSASADFA